MANCYTTITACETFRATAEEASTLRDSLDETPLIVEHCDGEVLIYAEDSLEEDELPEDVFKYLGELLTAVGLPFLQFGVAYTCDKNRVGSHGGGYFRITNAGKLIRAMHVWPV